jgi:hypothetical protein
MRRHIRPRCADTSHWWGVPETRLTRAEANLQTDSPQLSGNTIHMPRAGTGFAERREGPTPSRSKGPSQRMAMSPHSHSPSSI